jgi:hypothetical protein
MSLAILSHFLYAQHVSDINISIIRSSWLCWWIITLVVFFCKDGWFSVSVNLRCIAVCVWCDVFCRFVVVGRCIFHFLCAQHTQEKQTHYFKRPLTPSPHIPHEQNSCASACKMNNHLKPAATKAPTYNELRYVQPQIHITKYINKVLITKQPKKNTTQKRSRWSQSIIDSGQHQLKYTYQLQQSDKTHHTKHTPLYTVNLH